MIKKWNSLPKDLYKHKMILKNYTLWALATEEKIFAISFHNDFSKDIPAKTKKISILEKLEIELQEYFQKKRKQFTITTKLVATDFQKEILTHLKKIPYGKTISYKELAIKSGKGAHYARAVGMVMNHNPLPMIFPCHRVVGSDNQLVGFGGGLPLKKQLLELEQNSK